MAAPFISVVRNQVLETLRQPAGELIFTVFPGREPFFGCTRLDGVPIAPADAHRLLEPIGEEHGSMAYIRGRVSVSPRRSM